MNVSVVCGTWNRLEMVTQMIEAVLAQTRQPDAIIIVDDCSTDGTYLALKQRYADKGEVKIYQQLKNTGGVPNWNSAVNYADTDLIAWCSDDDRFLTDHLERSVKFLEENLDVDIVHAGFCEVVDINDNSSFIKNIDETLFSNPSIIVPSLRSNEPLVVTGKDIIPYFLKYFSWPFHPSTLVFKRETWEKIGQFDSTFELADSDWFIRAALDYKIAYLPYYGVLNRRHQGNWSTKMGSIRMQQELNQMMLKCMVELKSRDPSFEYNFYLKKWQWFYFLLLSRISISRARGGFLDVAKSAALEARNSLPNIIRKFMPIWLFVPMINIFFGMVSQLQSLIPSQRKKYENLGVSAPK
jgi:glycosyltransferase involved in cell wall biosynthesis